METMDYNEAAVFLHITPGTLRNWVSLGKIKPLKQLGKKGRVLFIRAELEAWLANRSGRMVAGGGQINFDHEKRLCFNILLFDPKDPGGSKILASIAEFSIKNDVKNAAEYSDIRSEELRAIARAFLQEAEARETSSTLLGNQKEDSKT